MPTLPTVRVKSSHPDHVQGFYTINESDFDPKKHELWEEDKPAQLPVNEFRPETVVNTPAANAVRKPHPVNDQKLHLPMHERKG
jgi:hypothetical protein